MPTEIGHNPFLHHQEVIKIVPPHFYLHKGKLDFSWFITAPKYSTFRVNTSKYKNIEVLDTFRQTHKEVQSYNGHISNSFIHSSLPDCIVIGNNNNDVDLGSVERLRNVIVDVPCANSVLRGAHVFAPGILGLSQSAKEGDFVNILADIENKCKRGFAKDFEGKTYYVGYGILRMDRNDLFKNNTNPKGIGVEVIHNLSGIPRIDLPREFGILQNLPSIVCGHLFADTSGHVLDMCASPGNKTTHIASLIGNKGHVTAIDKTPAKVERITSLCSDFGVENVTCFSFNSTRCVLKEGGNDAGLEPPFKQGAFAAVLLDPPCSGLGQRPRLHNQISSSQLHSYVLLQRRLFRSAVEVLSPGGMLVYSTCTITVEENEGIVGWALREYPCLMLQKITPSLGQEGIITESLSEEAQKLVTRFGHPNPTTPDEDTIGFFIAKFIKS